MGGQGSGGHNKVPAEIRHLKGNPGKRKAPPAAVDDKDKDVDVGFAPKTLKDEEARKMWSRVKGEMPWLTKADRGVLEQYSVALAVRLRLELNAATLVVLASSRDWVKIMELCKRLEERLQKGKPSPTAQLGLWDQHTAKADQYRTPAAI